MSVIKEHTAESIIKELESLSNPEVKAGQAKFGIETSRAFGIQIPVLRKIAKRIGRDHKLVLELWETGYHEGRILATMIDDPAKVTKKQMNAWVKDFDSWDVCDLCCSNLFSWTPYGHEKAIEWCVKKEEFVKRAGFALMAALSVHDKTAEDARFEKFFPFIKSQSIDERNFVKKAVNWALRQIGKRNRSLNQKALIVAKEIDSIESKSARWVAKDAIRELTNPKTVSRIKE